MSHLTFGEPMVNVGMIGLGVMGRPMARNLLAEGYPVTVHNRSRDVVDELVAEGARRAASAAEVAAASEIVITCLPDPQAVDAVILDEAFLDALAPGSILIDTSTVTPDLAKRVAASLQDRGSHGLDAPVSGGEAGAIKGALSIMVGGDQSAFEAAEPVLKVLGSVVVRVGAAGAGQTVKAANQVLVGGTIQLVGEALSLLGSAAVDEEAAIEVLCGGLAGNEVLRRKGVDMLSRRFEPGFRVDLHVKDLDIALSVAKAHRLPLPVTALVLQFLTSVQAYGGGSLDHSALITVTERLANQDAVDR